MTKYRYTLLDRASRNFLGWFATLAEAEEALARFLAPLQTLWTISRSGTTTRACASKSIPGRFAPRRLPSTQRRRELRGVTAVLRGLRGAG